jgi:hypothetical protein
VILSRIRSLIILAGYLFFAVFWFSSQAQGEEFDLTATLSVAAGSPATIPELQWKSFNPVVKSQVYRGQDNLVAILEGTFKKEKWTFFCYWF